MAIQSDDKLVEAHSDHPVVTLRWITRNGKPECEPLVPGTYAVMISGDSETDGPYVVYEYPDYQTFAEYVLNDDEEEDRDPNDPLGCFAGGDGIEDDSVFAWYGPLEIPSYTAQRQGERT